MKREYRDLLFAVCVMAVIGWAVFEARQWDLRARLFPWAIGFPLLGLLLLRISLQLRAIRAGDEPPQDHADPGVSAEVARQRALSMVVWLLAFAALIWALGFPVGGTLGTLAYLKVAARERWPLSGAITAGTGLFFFVLVRFLNIPFPVGTLLDVIVD